MVGERRSWRVRCYTLNPKQSSALHAIRTRYPCLAPLTLSSQIVMCSHTCAHQKVSAGSGCRMHAHPHQRPEQRHVFLDGVGRAGSV